MAKRSRKKGTKRRARRVGAMSLNPNSAIMKLAAVAGSYLLVADTINPLVDTATKSILPTTTTVPASGTTPASTTTNKTNQTIIGAAEAGLGALLLMKKRGSWITLLAGGLAAGAGLKRLLKAYGIVSGYQSIPVIGRARTGGYQTIPVIGGVPPQLSGVPPQLSGGGFRVNGPGYVPIGSGAKVMNGVGNGSGYTGASMSSDYRD